MGKTKQEIKNKLKELLSDRISGNTIGVEVFGLNKSYRRSVTEPMGKFYDWLGFYPAVRERQWEAGYDLVVPIKYLDSRMSVEAELWLTSILNRRWVRQENVTLDTVSEALAEASVKVSSILPKLVGAITDNNKCQNERHKGESNKLARVLVGGEERLWCISCRDVDKYMLDKI